jgi:hypothetical protein
VELESAWIRIAEHSFDLLGGTAVTKGGVHISIAEG